jgi:hypothetical protein
MPLRHSTIERVGGPLCDREWEYRRKTSDFPYLRDDAERVNRMKPLFVQAASSLDLTDYYQNAGMKGGE